MTNRQITIHVGASKCGSSALQTALSATPTIKRRDGSKINYVAFDATRSCLIDKHTLSKKRGVYGYTTSPNTKALMKANLRRLRRQIAKYPSDILFSSEGWLLQHKDWEELLRQFKVSARVIVYVRPQVPVLNSAWWQWGAWTGQDFDKWMSQRIKATLWAAKIQKWSNIKEVSEIIVRPVPADIVSDFYSTILNALPPEAVERPNPSLPGSILRLFQRNRSLRPNAHNSKIDFALSSVLTNSGSTTWVLNEQWIDRIITETRSDNEALLKFMDAESAQNVKNDPRWWRAEAFSDKTAESPDPQPISNEKLEDLCVEMAQAILDLKEKSCLKPPFWRG